MNLERRLARAEWKVAALERIIEERSRDLYLARVAAEGAAAYAESVILAMSHGLLVTDERGRIERANPAAAALLGGDAAALCGARAGRWLPRAAVRTIAAGLRADGRVTLETTIEGGRASSIPVLLTAALIPATADRPTRMVATLLDLSERKHLEIELLAARKFEALGQLSAGVAHELNTPVQFIKDNLRFIGEQCQALNELVALMRPAFAEGDDDRSTAVREKIDEIDLDYVVAEIPVALEQTADGAARIASIVRSMKELSRASGERPVPMDLNRVVRNALVVARSEYKYVADVELELDESLPPIPLLGDQIGQVVLNLVTNAAHAVEERYAGTERRGTIRVISRLADDGAELVVADDGCGIPESARERIFDPFFTTKVVGKGTGQGLPIVRNIVVGRHGGQIRFETVIGEGTSFVVTLPRKAA